MREYGNKHNEGQCVSTCDLPEDQAALALPGTLLEVRNSQNQPRNSGNGTSKLLFNQPFK